MYYAIELYYGGIFWQERQGHRSCLAALHSFSDRKARAAWIDQVAGEIDCRRHTITAKERRDYFQADGTPRRIKL